MTTTFTIEIEENLGPTARRKIETDLEDVINMRNYTLYDCNSEVDGDDKNE